MVNVKYVAVFHQPTNQPPTPSLPLLSSELVDPDFTLEIEVYCSLPAEDSAVKSSSTPIKMLKKFRHKVRHSTAIKWAR